MSYVWAGYALTWAAMAWFVWRLERRARAAARRLQRTGPGADAPTSSPPEEHGTEKQRVGA